MNFLDKLKGALRSLTIWFNGVLLAALPLVEVAKAYLPELQGYVTPEVYKWMGLAVVIGNILLRFKTRLPLEAR